MNKLCLALLVLSLSMAAAAGESATGKKDASPDNSPWIPIGPDEPVLTMWDVPLTLIHAEPEKYRGKVFEDSFKYYHIYHDKEDADPDKLEQTILGETHFTARPVQQSVHVIRIRITPEQEEWIRNKGTRRQDVLKARVRFVEIAPSGSLAFELLEIEESIRSWRLRRTGE